MKVNGAFGTAVSSGRAVSWFSFGSGKAAFVIFPGLSIHSLSGSMEALKTAFSAFLDIYTVYVIEPGPVVSENSTVGTMTDAYASLMKKLGIKKADVFGVSLGGMYVMALSANYPELVRRAVIASSTACVRPENRELFRRMAEAADAMDERKLAGLFVENVYGDRFREQYGDLLYASASGISDAEFRRFSILTRSCENADLKALLPAVRCPVFVLASKDDRVFDFPDAEAIAEATGGRLFLYSGYGHAVYDEAPDFRNRILQFLTDGDL